MAEYIDRREVVEAICFNCSEINICVGVCDDTDRIINIPAADVRPVIRGRWINEERVGFGSVEAECSNCGRRMIYNPAWRCCPWCMADMRGGDAE